jgi:hypothetical protein
LLRSQTRAPELGFTTRSKPTLSNIPEIMFEKRLTHRGEVVEADRSFRLMLIRITRQRFPPSGSRQGRLCQKAFTTPPGPSVPSEYKR